MLQIEQIAQKTEKRARTRAYLIQKAASGSWIPLWSEGIKVSMNPPCTDETRVELKIGDIVKVTRWKRYVCIVQRIWYTNCYVWWNVKQSNVDTNYINLLCFSSTDTGYLGRN